MIRRLILLSIILLPLLGFGQSTDATLSGGVTDPAGNFIQGADVEIANDATGVVYPASTNTSGMFLVPVLPPGHYHVQVSKTGFKTIIKADVVLNVQSALALNFILPVGPSSESVTVNAASSLLNTTDAAISTVIDRKFVENIPLNGRSFQDLISLTPGIVTQSPQSSSQVGTGGDFAVNGQRSQSNYYTVDGVTANIGAGNGGGVGEAATGGVLGGSTALGTTQTLVSVDALAEFRVQSSTYSAEYGRSPGGQFSLVTRSGANTLHGSAFEYLRNDAFDARDWFDDYYGTPATALRQSDFGSTLGGPVVLPALYDGRDKTFFFVSYEGLRLTQPTPASIEYVPDVYMRQQAVAPMRAILNAFPVPNGMDYGNASNPSLAEFIAPFSLPSSIDSTSVRVDHTFGPKLSLFYRFGDTPSNTVSRPYVGKTTTTSDAVSHTFGASSQLSSKLSNEFRLGYAHASSSQIGVLDTFGGAAPLDLTSALGGDPRVNTEPVVALDVPGIGQNLLSPYFGKNASTQWNIVDTVTLALGRHSLKAGLDYRVIQSPITPPIVEPYAEFLSPATLLAGAPDVTEFINRVAATPVFHETALFAQDEWRLHPKLSLSLGLRWEANPPPSEKHGLDAYTLQGNLGNPGTLSVASRGTALWKSSWFNFAPRAGFAWTAHSGAGAETVVRAGGGAFFDTANEVAALGYSGLGFDAYQLSYDATIPFTSAELNVPISVAPPYTSATIFAFPKHLQLPYTLEWNVSLQQALEGPQTLTISYVGANGRRLLNLQEFSLTALNPNFGLVEYPAAGITSNYQALQVQFQRSMAKGLQALASYTWSHSLDFGSNSAVLPEQRGNSDFDVRNNMQIGMSSELPLVSGGTRFARAVVNGWGADARLSARSAFPVTLQGNLTTDPTTGNLYGGGLNLVAGQAIYIHSSRLPGGRAINPAAFSEPADGSVGNAPRNFVQGFDAAQLNLALRRRFELRHGLALLFRAEAFNVTNHPNFGYVDPYLTDATFGQATKMLNASLGTLAAQYQQGGSRSMQFALRLNF